MNTKTQNQENNKVEELKENETMTMMRNATGDTKQTEEEKEKQKRKYSPNYMLQNYKTLIKNLDETGMLDDEDREQLKALGKKMVTRFISIDMFE